MRLLRVVATVTVLAGATCAVLFLARLGISTPAGDDAASALTAHLSRATGWLLLGAWVWILICAAATGAELVAGGDGSSRLQRVSPHWIRPLMTWALGAGLAVTASVPAYAIEHEPGPTPIQTRLLDGLRLPELPSTDARPQPAPPARHTVRHSASHPTSHTVRSGESLSVIADRYGHDWTTVYDANRAAVGPDPDLIHPGQELQIPTQQHQNQHRSTR